MKARATTFATVIQPRGRFLWVAAIVALTLTVFTSPAWAVIVQTSLRTINAGRADFGSGSHQFGGPSGNATITYDWSTSTGQLRVTGRVRGTLYVDSAFSSACARLVIRFRDSTNANLAVRQIDKCGPGGDANDAHNHLAVDESFTSVSLDRIVLTAAEIVNGSAVSPVAINITQVTGKTFPVTINDGTADFGSGGHHFGHPDNPGQITFVRNGDGTVTGGVDGILYWDAAFSSGCASMIIDYDNSAGTLLHRSTNEVCGPGGDANNQANEFFISEGFASGSLSEIRIQVEDVDDPTHGVLQGFNFAGQVGTFEVEPADAVASVNEPIHYSLTWTVPEPRNWHSLEWLELRIVDGSDAILHLRFEEASHLISVFSDTTGSFGKGFPVGSNKRLQTLSATLDLGETTVGPVNSALGFGPESPTVRLDLALRFKPSAAGKTYRVEVAARDDLGNEDPFTLAGTLTVAR